MSNKIKVKVENLNLYYGENHALKDVNMDIQENAVTAFIGPSGCGKSTFLKTLNRMNDLVDGVRIDGKVLLDGEDIYDPSVDTTILRKKVGMVFQQPNPFPMSIYDNIAYGPRVHGIRDKKRLDQIVEESLRGAAIFDEVKDRLKKSAMGLSGGQQQRIAIARALVNEPEILMLDEPLGALDLKMRKEMQIELKNMHDQLGITFIYVTHDQEEALTMSDKIVVLSEGKIQQIGTPEDIYNEPKNAFVADFIGESNIFKGIMTGHMKVRFCGGEFVGMDDVPEGTLVDVVIRPEDVIITKPEDGTVVGEVTSVIFKGMHYEVAVESGKYEMIIRTTRCYHVGDTVGMQLEPDGIHVMLAEDHTTSFVTTINGDYTLDFNGKIISCDLTQVIPKTKMSDGVLVDENGENVDVSKFRVVVSIQPDDIEMSDDVTAGLVSGKIINLIYKGDHYSYVIRTEYGHDLIVDDEYLWNMDDQVGLIMPEEKMKFQLKK